MPIAVIERFSDPSRNCDADSLGDDVEVVRLGGSGGAVLAGRCLAAVASIIADGQLPVRDKVSLIKSALETGGAPFAALAGTPAILRMLRSRRFDRLDCFALRGFALIPCLSRLFQIPYREFLADSTRYFGEFGFELQVVVPYAYWLHRNGRLRKTQSTGDTKCFYYFSPDHQELPGGRSFIPVPEYPNGVTSRGRFDVHAFPRQLDTTQWTAPPYKSIFRNTTLQWSKELCIVCNKFTAEPSILFRHSVNFIAVPDLLELLKVLTPHYQVVYVRPRSSDIVNDHQPIEPFGDFEAIATHFPEVLTIQQLHALHPEFTFNELQMRLFANCERFISVLGGSAYLASYFGGTNVVYARAGWEVQADAYTNWFHLFSGARMRHARKPRELHEMVRQEFVSGK